MICVMLVPKLLFIHILFLLNFCLIVYQPAHATTINIHELEQNHTAIWLESSFTTYHWVTGKNGPDFVRGRFESHLYLLGVSLGLHDYLTFEIGTGFADLEHHMHKPIRERTFYDEGLSFKTGLRSEFPLYRPYAIGAAIGAHYLVNSHLSLKSAQDPRVRSEIDIWRSYHYFMMLTWQHKQVTFYGGPSYFHSHIRGEHKNREADRMTPIRLHGDRYPIGWVVGFKFNFHEHFKGTIEGRENNERGLSIVLTYAL